jgi:urease accessory protein
MGGSPMISINRLMHVTAEPAVPQQGNIARELDMNRRTISLAALSTLLMTTFASAHPGHGAHDLVSGLAHPSGGLDHVLAMIAVGLLATGLGKRSMWMLPLTFVGFMTLGAAAGAMGLLVPSWIAENGIAASVFALGLFVTLGSRVPLSLATVATGMFAICHGAAHAAEMPGGQSPVAFFGGFIVATAVLHAIGIGLGLLAAKLHAPALVKIGGGVISTCGALIAIGAL